MVTPISRLFWGFFPVAAMLAASAGAQEAALEASVDRSTLRENESFSYILRAEGRVAGQPDISAIEQDFDILNRSSSTRIQSLGGRTEQVAEWVFQLMPRGPGNFTLPAVSVADLISNPVELEVLPALVSGDAPADIFMEVELDRSSAYVQSQVIYTLRLFLGVGTGRATLTPPGISGGEAIVERLGEDQSYQTTRGDRDFLVRERRYAVFPQQSGEITIGPSTFEAMVIPNRGFSRVQRLRSDVVSLEVKPAVAPPASHPGASWLPAAALTLNERWADQSETFSLGVPRTRVLSIAAHGLLETQLPELDLGQAEGIRQYPDQPELERQITENGIEAERIERYAVIAQTAGEVTIPAAELPWWNINEERWEVARIEPRILEVLPGESQPPIDDAGTAPAAEPRIEAPAAANYWPWLSAVLGLGWFATALAWLRSRRQYRLISDSEEPALVARPPSGRSLFKQLKAACAVGDAERAQALLLDWAKLQFPQSPPASLGALAESLDGPLSAEIAALEAHLYGRNAASWDGDRLGRLLREIDSVSRQASKTASDPLVPLYR